MPISRAMEAATTSPNARSCRPWRANSSSTARRRAAPHRAAPACRRTRILREVVTAT
jgi:hypothetical protein